MFSHHIPQHSTFENAGKMFVFLVMSCKCSINFHKNIKFQLKRVFLVWKPHCLMNIFIIWNLNIDSKFKKLFYKFSKQCCLKEGNEETSLFFRLNLYFGNLVRCTETGNTYAHQAIWECIINKKDCLLGIVNLFILGGKEP